MLHLFDPDRRRVTSHVERERGRRPGVASQRQPGDRRRATADPRRRRTEHVTALHVSFEIGGFVSADPGTDARDSSDVLISSEFFFTYTIRLGVSFFTESRELGGCTRQWRAGRAFGR